MPEMQGTQLVRCRANSADFPTVNSLQEPTNNTGLVLGPAIRPFAAESGRSFLFSGRAY
jgi:hypothetical protein